MCKTNNHSYADTMKRVIICVNNTLLHQIEGKWMRNLNELMFIWGNSLETCRQYFTVKRCSAECLSAKHLCSYNKHLYITLIPPYLHHCCSINTGSATRCPGQPNSRAATVENRIVPSNCRVRVHHRQGRQFQVDRRVLHLNSISSICRRSAKGHKQHAYLF